MTMGKRSCIEVFSTERVALSSSPLAQAVRSGNLFFVSGQVGRHPKTGLISDDFEVQARQTLENLKMIIEDAGGSMDDVVKVTVLLTDIGDFQKMNAIYREFFPGYKPSRTSYMVAGLNGNAQIEIDLIAVLPEKGDPVHV